jgi:membrane-bound serine protease (ClpP class)
LLSAAFAALAVAADVGSPAGKGAWLRVPIGIIGPASEDILDAALDHAQEHGYSGVIVAVDTPGGALDSTRNMVKQIMSAPLPVIAWVGPAGSRAGSAGAFITISAHIAAMAPGTNIGAAHPVSAGGQNVGDDEMERKVTNDTLAFIESIALKRNRNVEMIRSFVATSVSITDAEALQNNVIDLISKDVDSLLESVHGREVELESGVRLKLSTKDARIDAFEPSLRQKLLSILSNPNLFYLLFLAGIVGLGYELTHPGVLFPGVIGSICLILALIATSVLPISYGAAMLILAGVAMLIAEAFLPSFGVLGVGGVIAFVLGSVFLVDPGNDHGLRISWYAIAPGAFVVCGAMLALGVIVLRSERAPARAGREALIGQQGIALDDLRGGEGQIRVAGTIWRARLSGPPGVAVSKGDRVVVRAIEGLVVEVEKI